MHYSVISGSVSVTRFYTFFLKASGSTDNLSSVCDTIWYKSMLYFMIFHQIGFWLYFGLNFHYKGWKMMIKTSRGFTRFSWRPVAVQTIWAVFVTRSDIKVCCISPIDPILNFSLRMASNLTNSSTQMWDERYRSTIASTNYGNTCPRYQSDSSIRHFWTCRSYSVVTVDTIGARSPSENILRTLLVGD